MERESVENSLALLDRFEKSVVDACGKENGRRILGQIRGFSLGPTESPKDYYPSEEFIEGEVPRFREREAHADGWNVAVGVGLETGQNPPGF